MNTSTRFYLIIAGGILVSTFPSHAVSVGQVDTFEDGTTQNWVINLLGMGGGVPGPANALGGPAGSDDNYLRITSLGGAGPGSRFNVINFQSQWAGDYIGAGIQAISMDVNNFGPEDVYLRLLFSDPTVGPPQNIAYSQDPIHVPAGSGWISISFPVAVSDLNAGIGDIATALMNTTELRIYHSVDDAIPGPPGGTPAIATSLGVDNIRAFSTAVPDQNSTAVLLGTAVIGLCVLRSAHRSWQAHV